MKTETKELLKDQIQEVNKSRTSFIVGAVMVTLDIVLVLSSVLNTYSLILVLPLVYVVRRQFILYKIKNSSLALMESLIEGKFKLTKKA
jgi:7,8-dihydro-6-hydroxymethylpterin-pyrophosphokinase